MRKLMLIVLGAIATVSIGMSGQAAAQGDLKRYVPQYTPHEQTPSERLQNFRPPPPPPKQDTFLDKAARTYENAPVRPSFNPSTKAPEIQVQKKF
jgi:hypothetical protein